METWQVELIKIGATALASFFIGFGSYWFRSRGRQRERRDKFEDYLTKREIEKSPEQETLREVEKLTTLYIQHQKHRISPTKFEEFKQRIIPEAADETELRSLEEVAEAEEEFFDKVWYDRHKMLERAVNSGRMEVDPKIWQRALKAAKEVEQKYGKEHLGPYSDFEWAMIIGKLSTLRWVLSDEWDNLDT